MKLLISGSVGVGKSSVSKKLSEKFKIRVLEIDDLIKKNPKIVKKIDEEVKILELKEVEKTLENFEKFIFPNHVSHLLKMKNSELIILSCDLKILKSRLKKRNYSQKKIEQNLDVERFKSIFFEAEEMGKKFIQFDNSKNIDLVVKKIIKNI